MALRLLLILTMLIPSTWNMLPCGCDCCVLSQKEECETIPTEQPATSCCASHATPAVSHTVAEVGCCSTQQDHDAQPEHHADENAAHSCPVCTTQSPEPPFDARVVVRLSLHESLTSPLPVFVGLQPETNAEINRLELLASATPESHSLRSYPLPIHQMCRVWLN